jgi:hypothetical protein
MTADELRSKWKSKLKKGRASNKYDNYDAIEIGVEIAVQLAELNASFRKANGLDSEECVPAVEAV